jgi:hypothetical protein
MDHIFSILTDRPKRQMEYVFVLSDRLFLANLGWRAAK